jgi:uncharacterized ferritin-like protein (DUF455 family)
MPLELRALARQALLAATIPEKLAATALLENAERTAVDANARGEELLRPGRPDLPLLVPAKAVARRGLSTLAGRAALLHAIAHIEFNAINLACDAVQRFAGMPEAFYRDWASVAVDEARHFGLLQDRLAELGFRYGDFNAHDGLWDMAERTRGDCGMRMALVPRLLEARGLDVTPGMIDKLTQCGDHASVAVLQCILDEEIRHVAIGTHWFNYCCAQRGEDPERAFIAIVSAIGRGALRGPFNRQARRASGFSDYEMAEITRIAGN